LEEGTKSAWKGKSRRGLGECAVLGMHAQLHIGGLYRPHDPQPCMRLLLVDRLDSDAQSCFDADLAHARGGTRAGHVGC
jgi:hypothetical protein